MAIVQYGLAAIAVLATIVNGQNFITTSIAFDTCVCNSDLNDDCIDDGGDFDTDRVGSQLRTYGNLCAGSRGVLVPFDDDDNNNNNNNINDRFFDIKSRVGDPFRTLCGLIDNFPNVITLMARGNAPHTIFAPPDSAWSKIEGLIDRIPTERLLELHILPSARLTSDLRCEETYRTLNTNQNRFNAQLALVRCVNAHNTQILGPGNLAGTATRPTIGVPNNVFDAGQFTFQHNFMLTTRDNPLTTEGGDGRDSNLLFSQNVIACNGVIHVVDNVLLPEGSRSTGNGRQFGVGGSYYRRPNRGYYGGRRPPNYYWRNLGAGHGDWDELNEEYENADAEFLDVEEEEEEDLEE